MREPTTKWVLNNPLANQLSMEYIRNLIRNVPDFPKEGIAFKDITPVLSDIEALRLAVKEMASPFNDSGIDVVVGIESRGFIFGTPITTNVSIKKICSKLSNKKIVNQIKEIVFFYNNHFKKKIKIAITGLN